MRTGGRVLDVVGRQPNSQSGKPSWMPDCRERIIAADGYTNPQREWEMLWVQTVLGATTRADLGCLVGSSEDQVPGESY